MNLFKKSGGGFLNGDSGTIVDYRYDGTVFGEGEDAYTALSVELLVQPDGADEPVKQFLSAGFLYDGMTVSEDGHTIDGADDGAVKDDSDFARFIQSLVEAGFPVAKFTVPNDFTPMNGARVTFAKEPNVARQMAAGRKKLGKQKAAAATTEEIMLAGRRQDKNDKKKFYNHDRLIVSAFLAEGAGVTPAPAKKGAAKAAPKAAAAKTAAKTAPAAVAAASDDASDVDTQAKAVLLALLSAAKDNTIQRAQISSLIVRKALEDGIDTETRETLRKRVYDESFLALEDGWVYAATAKGAPIALATA